MALVSGKSGFSFYPVSVFAQERGWGICASFEDSRKTCPKKGQKKRGVPKPGCFRPRCLQFLRRSALLRPFALALLWTCVYALLRSFALICALLRSFACFCVFLHPTAFRTTAFGNCRKTSQKMFIWGTFRTVFENFLRRLFRDFFGDFLAFGPETPSPMSTEPQCLNIKSRLGKWGRNAQMGRTDLKRILPR